MEQQKEKVSKKLFKISDLAKELDIKKSVLRLWEKEFDFCFRGDGEERGYSAQEKKTFSTIKDLICKQQFSVDAAKEHLLASMGISLQKNNEEPAIVAQGTAVPCVEPETFQPAQEIILQDACAHDEVSTADVPVNEGLVASDAVCTVEKEDTVHGSAIRGAYLEKEEISQPVFVEQISTSEVVEGPSESFLTNTDVNSVLVAMDKRAEEEAFAAQCGDMKQRLIRFKVLLENLQI